MKISKIILLAMGLFLTVSCQEDFLDTVNPNAVASDNFWKDESDAKLALMGCYSSLQSPGVFDSDIWGAAGVHRLDYISDDGYIVWNWMEGGDIATGQHTPSSWIIGDEWGILYKGISRCNQVIYNVPKITNISEASAKRIVAEAKVIRATIYNILGMTYQDVPLITEPQTVQTANVPKNSRAEIYDFITKDVAQSAADLPLPSEISSADFGRIDQGAAYGMLARFYLYNNQYPEAAAAAKKVIDMGYYILDSNYKTLFKTENETSREVVFRVAFDRILDEGSSWMGFWGSGPMDFMRPLPNLADEFYMNDGKPATASALYNPAIPSENRDPRFSATLVSNGDIWRGTKFEGKPEWYYTRKYAEEDNDEDHFNSSQDYYVLRYADVLLMRAEALLGSGSYDPSEVIALIDQVRARVHMPSVATTDGSGVSKDQLLKIVKHERRVEFAFEGLRYFDLIRWNELDGAYQKYMQSEYQRILDLGYSDVTGRKFRSNRWPLPQGELDVNHSLVQHPEW